MDTVALQLPGAHCGSCRAAILRVLTGLPGVQHADVDLRARTGTVAFDRTQVTIDEIVGALTAAGYPPALDKDIP